VAVAPVYHLAGVEQVETVGKQMEILDQMELHLVVVLVDLVEIKKKLKVVVVEMVVDLVQVVQVVKVVMVNTNLEEVAEVNLVSG